MYVCMYVCMYVSMYVSMYVNANKLYVTAPGCVLYCPFWKPLPRHHETAPHYMVDHSCVTSQREVGFNQVFRQHFLHAL